MRGSSAAQKGAALSQSSGGRTNSDAQKGVACSYVTLWLRGAVLALPTASSGERRTHSSE